jgi:hypothetical protein
MSRISGVVYFGLIPARHGGRCHPSLFSLTNSILYLNNMEYITKCSRWVNFVLVIIRPLGSTNVFSYYVDQCSEVVGDAMIHPTQLVVGPSTCGL